MSDIALNDLSNYFNIGILKSLQPYFENQSILISATAAGITIVVALLINMIISYFLLGFIIPNTLTRLLYFSISAFIVGYIIDVFICKMKIFGNRLDAYYEQVGAGIWGATAFVFSIIISYIIQNYIIPIL
jgi:hypothetical protein